ncbi:cytochrome bd-I ubiquinol oxidase subunit 2 apoprotein [Saccharopolyspora kobensis]|uniref:Cytochrome bd-I ubiquinol oxidase subunit 2 apoprotein n=1 Tax=Saccharopolyspora kobensis TaxID=146035 RepID=A0A1H6DF94_9PSEU|nr:cytochrome d ubiquinol oxidase subunit II [Saccharopolyspora kobensis]SEG84127.1 cytochrome bd-I ubiquinol oxidase subunit 2 apoprotein [Saccharopolyspora kobensis]SFD29626.1 cytochrome bd-I ubiquinol oxidase subunit 2 apoprotein [Saccharopolyspora kobensis]
MDLPTFWFCVIALLWLGYLFLEGFDFGVGMLLPILGRKDVERRVLINTIGPVWDGNEVWLIVAGGAMFASFPGWYASLFSTAYLPLLLLLVALIGRGVAFEYRGKVDTHRWRRNWDRVIVAASWISPLVVGLVLSANVFGLPLDERGDRVGGWWTIFSVPSIVGALAVCGFSLLHGAVFLSLKTEGEIRERARRFALRMGVPLLLPVIALLFIAQFTEGSEWTWVPLVIALVAALAGLARLYRWRDGQAFALQGVALASVVITLFGALWPNVIPSTLDATNSLSIADTASSPYTLTVITWVAAFGTPAVLIYQGWTYWVFRKRIGTKHIPPVHAPSA